MQFTTNKDIIIIAQCKDLSFEAYLFASYYEILSNRTFLIEQKFNISH